MLRSWLRSKQRTEFLIYIQVVIMSGQEYLAPPYVTYTANRNFEFLFLL